MKRLLTRFTSTNDGSMAIEAAVALPVFLLLILGIISLSHAAMVRQSMYYGIDHAARQAMVTPSTSNADLQSAALSRMPIDTTRVTISATDSTVSGTDYKNFAASYTYNFPQYVGLSDVTMNVNISVPIN